MFLCPDYNVGRAVGGRSFPPRKGLKPAAEGLSDGATLRFPVMFPAIALILTAAAPQSAMPQAPFRTSTRLVQINVVVHDKNGPVANLTKNDFTVSDRGKPQIISIFSVESVAAAANEATVAPQNTFSNKQRGTSSVPNAVTIVLLDRVNTFNSSAGEPYEYSAAWIEDHALGSAKQQLLKFVKNLDPKESVAIYSLGKSLSVLCDFTSDRRELTTILSKYRATSLTNGEEVNPHAIHTPVPGDFNAMVDGDRRSLARLANAERTATTMTALMEIAAHVANIPGRKNLVWLTANLPFSGIEIARALSRANIAIYPVDARGLLPHAPPVIEDAGSYVASLNPRSLSEARPAGLSTMQELADETGGRAFVNTNDLSGAIRKAMADSVVTYTLGFYVESQWLDGKFHDLKVRVDRSGLDVRYPKGYFALKDIPASDRQNNLQTALRSPLEFAAIPLLAQIDKVSEPMPNSLRIAVHMNIQNIQLAESGDLRKGMVEIYLFQQDAAGLTIDQKRQKLSLSLTKEDYAAYLKSGISFQESVQPKNGLATLRILAGDPSGDAIGSLIIPVTHIK